MLRDLAVLLLILLVPFGIGVWLMMRGPGSETVIRILQRGVETGWLARGAGALIVVVTVGAIGVGIVRAKATPAAWERFADRHGLEFFAPSSESALGRAEGVLRGREVRVGIRTSHDLHRRERRTWMEFSVAIQGAPKALGVVRKIESPGFVRDLVEGVSGAMGVPGTIEFQDPEFDRTFSVRADDTHRESIRAWLNAERRALLVEHLSKDGYVVTGGKLAYQNQHPLRDENRLREILDDLEYGARRLEEAQ